MKKYPVGSGLVVAGQYGISGLANNRQGYSKYVGVVRDGKLNNASMGESVGGNR